MLLLLVLPAEYCKGKLQYDRIRTAQSMLRSIPQFVLTAYGALSNVYNNKKEEEEAR